MAFEHVETNPGSGGGKFATERIVIGANNVDFFVQLLAFGPDGGPFTLVTASAGLPVSQTTAANLNCTEANSAAIKTSVELIDDVIATVGQAVPLKGLVASGSDGTNARALKTDASGELQVDVLTMPAITVSGNTTANQGTAAGHSSRWPVGLSDGAAFISPAQEHATAASPHAARLSDGTAFYDAAKTGQLPTTLGQAAMAASLSVVIASNQSAVPVSQSGTWTEANSAAIKTAVELIDDTVHNGDAAVSKYVLVGAVLDDTAPGAVTENQAQSLRMTSSRALHVSIRDALPAGSNNIGDVDVLTLPALPAGTNNIGDVDVLTLPALPAGTNNIGDVDVLTLPALPAGNNNIGDVDLASPLEDADTGAGTRNAIPVVLVRKTSGAPDLGTSTDPVRVDPTGTTTQPVSGTVTANAGTGTFTVDTELPAAVALADATSAAPTTPTIGTVPLVMNATTLDRQRAVVNGMDSAGTGIVAAGLVGQLDDTATGAVTENQFAPVRISTRRALLVEGVVSGTNLNVALAASSATVSVDSELPTATALADATANPTAPAIASMAHLFNGTTWDRMRGDTANGLDVDVTRVSGNVTVVQTTASNLNCTEASAAAIKTAAELLDDSVHADDAVRGKSLLIGAVLDDTTPTTVTENQAGYLRMSSRRALLVEGVASGANLNVAVNAALPTGANVIGAVTQSGTWNVGTVTTVTTVSTLTDITNWGNVVDNAGFTDGTTRLSIGGYVLDEVAGTALTENDAAAARIDSKRAQVLVIEDETTRGRRTTVTAANALKVDGSAVTQPVSGTITANAGTGTFTVDTELPAAAALADGAANPTTAMVGSAPMQFNGSTYDRERNNHEVTVLSSAARTGDTNSTDQVNYNARGIAILLDVTAIGAPAGQIDAIRVQAKIGTSYLTIWSFSTLAINTTGVRAFLIYPGAATAGGWTAAPLQGPLPRNWRLQIDHANETDSITYSIVASYIN